MSNEQDNQVKGFKVCTAKSPEALQEQVAALIRQGWYPSGPMNTPTERYGSFMGNGTTIHYSQAMVTNEPQPEPKPAEPLPPMPLEARIFMLVMLAALLAGLFALQ